MPQMSKIKVDVKTVTYTQESVEYDSRVYDVDSMEYVMADVICDGNLRGLIDDLCAEDPWTVRRAAKAINVAFEKVDKILNIKAG